MSMVKKKFKIEKGVPVDIRLKDVEIDVEALKKTLLKMEPGDSVLIQGFNVARAKNAIYDYARKIEAGIKFKRNDNGYRLWLTDRPGELKKW